MSASSDRLRILVPEFASVANFPDVTLDVFLEAAALAHDSSVWGAVYGDAMIYYAAHCLALAYPGGAGSSVGAGGVAGPVTSRAAGDLSEAYGSASSGVTGLTVGDADMMTTAYGRRYLALRGSRVARGPRVVTAA